MVKSNENLEELLGENDRASFVSRIPIWAPEKHEMDCNQWSSSQVISD